MYKILLLSVLFSAFAIADDLSPSDVQDLSEIQVDIPKLPVILPQLNLASESVFAVNLSNQDVVLAKNENEVRAIASITKMMTSYVILQQPQIDLNQIITITQEDVDLAKRAHRASRLRPGMHFTRERLLNLALMSSENTAAAALGRTTFVGGTNEFVIQMNEMATSLGMLKTTFEDPIGIGTGNQSTASDLVRLLAVAQSEPIIREFSTTAYKPIQLPIRHSNKPTEYKNTNALVGFSDWDILVQKTGFTNAAGHCVVMIVDIQDQKYAVVVLDSPTNQQRVLDAIKVREWVEQGRELTTDEAKPLSPYKFVFVTKGTKRHHKHVA